MSLLQYKRRQFLQLGVTGVGCFLAGGVPALAANRSGAPFFSLANLGVLQSPDVNGIMLPAGFRSRIVARTGRKPISGADYRWHERPDGGACFATDEGGWIYVSNSEVRGGRGGVGALRFNSAGDVVDAYSILGNTSVNCAGGATPWGTWLSCEEFDRGQVYECDPYGDRPAAVRPAMGTFQHEAAAVDQDNNCVYLTEDERDGGFYRFVATNGLPDLSVGRLEVAALERRDGGDYVRWLEVPDALAEARPTREQVPEYQLFAGGEGIALHDGKVFFTTKRDNRVWCYDTVSELIEIIYDVATSANPILAGVDNVAITPAGDVLVCEDGGDMQIVVLTPDFRPLPLLQILGQEESEICGAAFDPSHTRLYFSSQQGPTGRDDGGITYEISAIPA